MRAQPTRLVWAPRALFALAALHSLVAVTDKVWLDIIDRGVVGVAAHGDALVRAEAGFTLYFAVSGIALFAMADAAASHLSLTGALPPRFGWYVLVVGLFILVVQFPLNGGWLVVALGAAVVLVDRHRQRATSQEGQQ